MHMGCTRGCARVARSMSSACCMPATLVLGCLPQGAMLRRVSNAVASSHCYCCYSVNFTVMNQSVSRSGATSPSGSCISFSRFQADRKGAERRARNPAIRILKSNKYMQSLEKIVSNQMCVFDLRVGKKQWFKTNPWVYPVGYRRLSHPAARLKRKTYG